MSRLLIVILLLLAISPVMSSNLNKHEKNEIREKLIEDVLGKQDGIRPVAQPLNVSVNFSIRHVMNIDQNRGLMEMNFQLAITWFDEKLCWNPANYSDIGVFMGDSSVFDQYEIWAPNIAIVNVIGHDSRESLLQTIFIENFFVNNKGRLTVHIDTTVSVSCEFDYSTYPADYVKCPIRIAPSSFADEVIMNESVDIVYITKHGERSVSVQEFWIMDILAYVDFLSTTETSRKLNRDQADQAVSVLTFEFVFRRFDRITGVQLRASLITITLLIGSCGCLLPGMELFVLIGSFAIQFVNFMTIESYLPADFDSTPPIVTIAGCLALETVFFIVWRFFSWQVRVKYDFPINTPSEYYLHESYHVLLMIVLAIDKIRPALYFFLCIVNLYNVVIYS